MHGKPRAYSRPRPVIVSHFTGIEHPHRLINGAPIDSERPHEEARHEEARTEQVGPERKGEGDGPPAEGLDFDEICVKAEGRHRGQGDGQG